MGSVGEKEQMNQTPNPPSPSYGAAGAEVPMPGAQVSADDIRSDLKHRTSNVLWRVLDFIVAAIFLYAGVLKMLDPVQFAHDVKNYQILPWTLSVALAFYLPWLYRGALFFLAILTVVFTLATAAAKIRGLDITCGCFGHASQHWSFPAHLATNLGILVALLALWFSNRLRREM